MRRRLTGLITAKAISGAFVLGDVGAIDNRAFETEPFSDLRTWKWPFISFACSALLARSLTRSRAHGNAVFVYEMNASISYSFNPVWTGTQKM